MSKPTRKELARRLVLVEQRLDGLEAAVRRRAVPPPPPEREVKRRPLVLRWFDQVTGLWGCSWGILAAVAAPAVAVLAGRWWL